MMRSAMKATLGSAVLAMSLSTPLNAAGDAKHPAAMDWSFNGLFGT